MPYRQKVIHIDAKDSPNVRLGMLQERLGQTVTHEELVPGVLSYREYKHRDTHWDPIRKCVSLHGQFYKGSEVYLYPTAWLDRTEKMYARLVAQGLLAIKRRAKGIGCDAGEGASNTAWWVVDEYGVMEAISERTPDTTDVTEISVDLIRRYNLPHESFVFDRGGGGKQHADRMRKMGYKVRTVAFGESLVDDPRYRPKSVNERIKFREERYAYKNRRAQMYGMLREMIDPVNSQVEKDAQGKLVPIFTIPEKWMYYQPMEHRKHLRDQIRVIPLKRDSEGRLLLPPKSRTGNNQGYQGKTLTELIGHSPDEADALVMAIYAMLTVPEVTKVGALL